MLTFVIENLYILDFLSKKNPSDDEYIIFGKLSQAATKTNN